MLNLPITPRLRQLLFFQRSRFKLARQIKELEMGNSALTQRGSSLKANRFRGNTFGVSVTIKKFLENFELLKFWVVCLLQELVMKNGELANLKNSNGATVAIQSNFFQNYARPSWGNLERGGCSWTFSNVNVSFCKSETPLDPTSQFCTFKAKTLVHNLWDLHSSLELVNTHQLHQINFVGVAIPYISNYVVLQSISVWFLIYLISLNSIVD